jgi:hypothetical protein
MLVHYKLVSGGSYTLLFDESAGDANEKFAPSFRDAVQSFAGYGAASLPKLALSNTVCSLAFRWSQNYATADLAATGIYTLRSTFKGVPVHLRVTVGAVYLYFPNAMMSASSHDQHGREVLHQMNFETDDVTTTAP